MTQAILKRIHDGQLPMHFFERADVDQLQDLRDAGYLKVSFGPPFEQQHRTSATVTDLTPLGQAAIRYFGFELGMSNSGPHQ